MDLREFRSAKVWLKVLWTPEADEQVAPDYEPPASFVMRVAYRPAAIGDKELPFVLRFNQMRAADLEPAQAAPPTRETEPQRRARERAQERIDATPPDKAEDQALGPLAVEFMERLIVDWDVVLDGEPAPLTRATFELFEPAHRQEIVGTILADYVARPNRMSSLGRSWAAEASGQTGPTSASTPSNGAPGNSPGTTPAAPSSDPLPSGSSG